MNYDKGGMRLLSIKKRIQVFRVKMLYNILSKPNDHLERFLVNFLISENKFKMGLDILKGSTLRVINTIQNEFYKNACKAWVDMDIKYIPPSKASINNLCIFENILLKNAEGRVFTNLNKVKNLPRTFDDLPFPVFFLAPCYIEQVAAQKVAGRNTCCIVVWSAWMISSAIHNDYMGESGPFTSLL